MQVEHGPRQHVVVGQPSVLEPEIKQDQLARPSNKLVSHPSLSTTAATTRQPLPKVDHNFQRRCTTPPLSLLGE